MQIEKRNIATAVILSIVTCGIYSIIWVIKMLKEAVKFKDESDEGTVEVLLGIFLCPVGFYMAEKKFAEGCQMRGIPHEDRSIMYLILGFVGLGIVNFVMMQGDLNKIADDMNPEAAYAAPQPQYQAPQYQAPQPQYQQPQYQAPVQPQYQQPQYQAPVQPQYQPPVEEAAPVAPEETQGE